MAYKTEELEKKALEAIKTHKLIWIDDIWPYMPCSKATMYNHNLEKLDSIKEAIETVKIGMKAGLRKKMYDSETPAAWAMLYKLIGSEDECDRINSQKTKVEVEGGVHVTIEKHVTG